MFCKGEGSALALRAVVPMSEEKLDGFFRAAILPESLLEVPQSQQPIERPVER
jgi:hypothetical protein